MLKKGLRSLWSGIEIIMENKTICVLGLGYVGLPLALNFSKHYKVIGFNLNKEKIERLRNGDDQDTLADTSKIEEKLGWKPKIKIEEGIKRFVD